MTDLADPYPPSEPVRNEPHMGLVAGPCSAESLNQLRSTAKELATIPVDYFRSGLWKPRSRPNSFQGVGEEGIAWLQTIRQETGLKVMTEVSMPEHVECVLKGELDAIWIGARTVSNPFAIQSVADSLKGVDIPVFIKNPISPDLDLWLGAIERIKACGIKNVTAVFRGFASIPIAKGFHRNTPYWSIAFELKRLLPELPLYCDPSHITGNRDKVEMMSRRAIEMGFDGLMIECHPEPEQALSDSKQQITPRQLCEIVNRLKPLQRTHKGNEDQLTHYRRLLSEIDETLIMVLARRMEVIRNIGLYKREHSIPILQIEQFDLVMKNCCAKARELGLDEELIQQLFSAIHAYSVKEQNLIDSSKE